MWLVWFLVRFLAKPTANQPTTNHTNHTNDYQKKEMKIEPNPLDPPNPRSKKSPPNANSALIHSSQFIVHTSFAIIDIAPLNTKLHESYC